MRSCRFPRQVYGASFNNNYNADYDSWDGFSYSCLGSDNFVSFTPDQYDVYNPTGKVNTGAGHDSNKFAIGYGSEYFGWPMITFDAPVKVKSFYLNNTSYVYNTIKSRSIPRNSIWPTIVMIWRHIGTSFQAGLCATFLSIPTRLSGNWCSA